nr:ORF2 [Torque teno felis virus]
MDTKKLHCAIWLQSCSRTHALWCDCGIWTSHIRGWRPTEGDEPGAVDGDPGTGDVIRIDAYGNLVDTDKKTVDG